MELKLYRIRESAYGKEKDYVSADAYVAAKSCDDAMRIFCLHFGERNDLNVSIESTTFLMGAL